MVACGGIKILVLLLAGQLRLQRALWLRCVGVGPAVHRFILRARILINGGSSMLRMQRGQRERIMLEIEEWRFGPVCKAVRDRTVMLKTMGDCSVPRCDAV